MSNNHPTNYDPVIGGQEISLSPVLGGIEVIKSALRSNDYEVRIRALGDALKYGEDGANLLMTVMQEDKDWRVQYWAWKILLESGNTRVKDFQIPYRKIDNIRARYKAGERDFRWADLYKANLNRADLRGADLNGANLSRVSLNKADLRDVNLSGADLSSAELSSADLGGANLRFADLREASLREAKLIGVDLSGADLRGADLDRANLKDLVMSCETRIDPKWRLVWDIVNGDANVKNLRGADLSGANLSCESVFELKGTDQRRTEQSVGEQCLSPFALSLVAYLPLLRFSERCQPERY